MEAFIDQIPQQLVNGLTLGAVYALIALGYSMVYGVLQLLNFAHGDIYMVGAFVGFFTLEFFVPSLPDEYSVLVAGLVIFVMIMVAMIACGFLGVAIEQFAYRPLRNAPRIAPLISALGMSFFLQNSALLLLGGDRRLYKTNEVIPVRAAVEVGDLRITAARIVVIVAAVIMMAILWYLVRRTRIGSAMRAVAIDREAAEMMGVNVSVVIAFTFFVGSALAGAAGVLNGLFLRQAYHFMGFEAGLKGFTAAVVGGIGSIPGAMVGGFLLGIIEAFATAAGFGTYRDTVAFAVLIVILLVKPSGLFGARELKKV